MRFFTSFLLYLFSVLVQGEALTVPGFDAVNVGKHLHYFTETDSKLTVQEALQHFSRRSHQCHDTNVLALGFNSAPVWLKISVNNTSQQLQSYRLSIDTAWLDYIDGYVWREGELEASYIGGDAYPMSERAMTHRVYAFEHDFKPGLSDILIRVENLGPMALPVKFSSVEQAARLDVREAYQYGLFYGLMLALALYNLVLYVFIRQREYGLYALYLIGFLLNSYSYTGQMYTLFSPDFGPRFADWYNTFVMSIYSIAGLHFARTVLATKEYARRLDSFVKAITVIVPSLMLIGFVFDQILFSAALIFIFNSTFVVLFVLMAFLALVERRPFALIFLLSSVVAALCISVSTLAVMGVLVPYTAYTYKAIEIGMAFEAIALAAILAKQFTMAKADKLLAENYARTDPLTHLNNRRGFQDFIKPRFQEIMRFKRDVSIALIDIDHFKKINDRYGHDVGDKVLVEAARCIQENCRGSDILARWGGEEFIIFLPETCENKALVQAERIRQALKRLVIDTGLDALSITASIGVAGSQQGLFRQAVLDSESIDLLINQADKALYSAKQGGRDKVQAMSEEKESLSLEAVI